MKPPRKFQNNYPSLPLFQRSRLASNRFSFVAKRRVELLYLAHRLGACVIIYYLLSIICNLLPLPSYIFLLTSYIFLLTSYINSYLRIFTKSGSREPSLVVFKFFIKKFGKQPTDCERKCLPSHTCQRFPVVLKLSRTHHGRATALF